MNTLQPYLLLLKQLSGNVDTMEKKIQQWQSYLQHFLLDNKSQLRFERYKSSLLLLDW